MSGVAVISGAGASWGEFCTIPFDTAKVRLQLQDKSHGKPEYSGLVDCLRKMVTQEGIRAPWRGVVAGIQRQCAFAPIRIGLYEPVRNFYQSLADKPLNANPSIWIRIAAGLTTSAVGITIASPTDVIKVRLQAQARGTADAPLRYTGVFDAYKKIVSQEGVRGLWAGYSPNLLRNCIVNATEVVVYDQSKAAFLAAGYQDNIKTHLMSGLTAGLAATVLGSPVDVVKTNVMNMRKEADSAAKEAKKEISGSAGASAEKAAQEAAAKVQKKAPFTGPLSCAAYLLRTQGPSAFYRGFIPNYARIGTWNVITFVTIEQLKTLYRSMNSS